MTGAGRVVYGLFGRFGGRCILGLGGRRERESCKVDSLKRALGDCERAVGIEVRAWHVPSAAASTAQVVC